MVKVELDKHAGFNSIFHRIVIKLGEELIVSYIGQKPILCQSSMGENTQSFFALFLKFI